MGRVQVKSRRAIQTRAARFLQFFEQIVQMAQSGLNGALEAFLFTGQCIHNRLAILDQLRISVTVLIDDHGSQFGHERSLQTDLGSEASRAANDHAANVIAANIPGNHAIRDQESHRPGVIRHHPIGGKVGIHLGYGSVIQLANLFHDRGKEVSAVIRIHVLHDRDDPLETHAGIHVGRRQRIKLGRINAIVLHENQVPDFEIALAIPIYRANMAGDILLVAELRTAVNVDFTARPAGTGLGHFPEVLLAAKIQHMALHHAGLLQPVAVGFFIRGEVPLIIFETGGIEFGRIDPPDLGQ